MKKILLGLCFATLPLSGMAATVLGFQVGGGIWAHDPGGDVTVSSGGTGTAANLKDDLQLGKKNENYFYFLLEHPVPLIPNIKYMNTRLSSSGSGTTTSTFTFNGTTYTASTAVSTDLRLNQVDTILYYEILDNDAISFDVGLTAKAIDGYVRVNNDSTAFSATIPMLYASAEIGLPFDMSVGAEISTISAGTNKVTDTTVKVSYTTSFLLGLEAGLRTQTYNIDVNSVKANINFSGLFFGAFYRF